MFHWGERTEFGCGCAYVCNRGLSRRRWGGHDAGHKLVYATVLVVGTVDIYFANRGDEKGC